MVGDARLDPGLMLLRLWHKDVSLNWCGAGSLLNISM